MHINWHVRATHTVATGVLELADVLLQRQQLAGQLALQLGKRIADVVGQRLVESLLQVRRALMVSKVQSGEQDTWIARIQAM